MDTYVDTLLPLPLEGVFTYFVPPDMVPDLAVGKRVLVSFGKNKFYSALIERIHHQKPSKYAVKTIIAVLDNSPIINNIQLEFWKWIAQYYVSTYGEVMANALPSAYRLASESKVRIHPDFNGDISSFNEKELRIVEILNFQNNLTINEIIKKSDNLHAMYYIKNLIEKEVVWICEEVEEKYRPKTRAFITLSDSCEQKTAEEMSQILQQLEQTTKTQAQANALLLFLSESLRRNTKQILKSELTAHPQVSGSALASLVKKDILQIKQLEISRLKTFEQEKTTDEIVLSAAQQAAFKNIQNSFQTKDAVLLHGVTGSGKTEIYIRLIQQTIDAGKQVLYLLPEIALTTQIISRLRVYFGDKIGVAHSNFNHQERIEIWENVLGKGKGRYQIILGARSAIFLPFDNLGLIIVDEEHDYSYKQHDPAPRYNARDAAVVLAQKHSAKVLLGSATPALETYYNAMSGKYAYVTLFQRYGNLQLPQIQIVDLKHERAAQRMRSHYSQTLLDAMKAALDKGEQIILFQNRRGFSLLLECKTCHEIPHCKNCDVTLTYHKNINKLQCHYCGYSISVPHNCPHCGEGILEMKGFGTEKIEEEIPLFLPNVKIARLDYDSTRSKSAYNRILNDFSAQKTDILVGTQMVTKGLDFDNVSLVGVLNADNMLNYPDFRALERSYQLLMQVSGRAGRKNKQGLVLIQTARPEHQIFEHLRNGDWSNFYEQTLDERKTFLYPPFCRLLRITLQHKKQDVLDSAAHILAQNLQNRFGKLLLGPEAPLISKIKNLYLKNILIKLPSNKQLSENKAFIETSVRQLCQQKEFRALKIQINIDVYS
jgi:primosomal protein N' (replication factor Y)